MLPGWSFCFGPSVHEWTAAGEQQFGNLIATQLPVLQVQHYPLPYPADENIRSMPRMCTVVTVQDPKLGPVRVMTTHLEYHSQCQRLAQARYLRRMHFEALSHTDSQPQFAQDGSPYQAKAHTGHAVLCGDFNFGVGQAEYEALMAKAQPMECLEAGWPERVVAHAGTMHGRCCMRSSLMHRLLVCMTTRMRLSPWPVILSGSATACAARFAACRSIRRHRLRTISLFAW